MYNPDLQYRCTIIRGKAKTELDNLLPAYCRIIERLCPIEKNTFGKEFNDQLSRVIHNFKKKTLDNHRTEIAGKLFGLWYLEDGIVYSSKMTNFLLSSEDNPAFFKNLVIKLQFPNGMDKIQTVKDRINHNINFRPTPFILAALDYACKKTIILTKREIAYYILNSLEVLQGLVPFDIVVERILLDRKKNIFKKVQTPGKKNSYDMQHITEFLELIELANLIRIKSVGKNEKFVYLNQSEKTLIDNIIINYNNKLGFDSYQYNLNLPNDVTKFYNDWNKYYTTPLLESLNLATNAKNLIDSESILVDDNYEINRSVFSGLDSLAIGDEGEMIALEFEKQRVMRFNTRLANKVIYFGKKRGLGYDISSIHAKGDHPEHAIFIEVKTTKRVTKPEIVFKDQFDMTRNEWIAAEQHINNYYIYRIYLYNDGAKIYKMESPVKLRDSNIVYAEPLKYHVEFDQTAGSFIHEQ